MIAPVPPPYGGIANWYNMISDYICKNEPQIDLSTISIAPKKRATGGRTVFERVFGSGIEMFRIRKKTKQEIKNGIDVIHMTTSGQLAVIRDILLLEMARRYSVPLIYHIRFGRIMNIAQKNSYEWKMIRKAIGYASVTIAIDMRTYDTIKEYIPKANVCYIPNPYNKQKTEKLHVNKEKTIVFVGSVLKEKGIEELLDAWNHTKHVYPDYILKVFGPYNAEYYAKLKKTYNQERTIFEGERNHNQILEEIAKAELLVLPSYTEGFPNVLLEAMALKTAIIATSVGAIPDMLDDNCGIVIEPRNSEMISKAISDLLSDEKKREKITQNAEKRLTNQYDLPVIFDQYMQLWEKNKREKEFI